MKRIYLLLMVAVIFSASCKETANPRPEAYFRITFPAHEYQTYSSETCPYSFEYPVYAKISNDEDSVNHPCWINVDMPQYKAHIHLTLKNVNDSLTYLLDDSHTLIYKHTVKADNISVKDFQNDSLKVYATIFYIEGNAASPLQFHITDSVRYFFRGSLYFNVAPNYDSLVPSIDFVSKDIEHLIESFEWIN